MSTKTRNEKLRTGANQRFLWNCFVKSTKSWRRVFKFSCVPSTRRPCHEKLSFFGAPPRSYEKESCQALSSLVLHCAEVLSCRRWSALRRKFRVEVASISSETSAAQVEDERKTIETGGNMEEERKAICGADEEREEALVALIAACVSHLEECEALKRLTALYLGGSLVNRDGEESDSDGNPRRKRSRIVSVRPDYSSSVWGKMLEDSSLADPTSQSAKLFRRRFRVP